MGDKASWNEYVSERVPNTKKASGKIATVMREYKSGKLHSGSKKGPKVKSRRQAVAIALSEARKKA